MLTGPQSPLSIECRMLKTALLLAVLVLGCRAILPGREVSDDEADRIAANILKDLDAPEGQKILNMLKVPDPEVMPEEQEMASTTEDTYEISPRFDWSKFATTMIKVGRSISTAVKNSLLSFFRQLRKISKYVYNKVSQATKKVWEKLKEKIKGPLKEKMKKAGKKLVKKVLREVFEEGAELALEYVQALLVEYMHEKTQEEFCECPMADDSTKCKCCVQPPGFAKGCMVVRARPRLGWFVFSFRYNGTEFMKAKIAEDDRGPCQKGQVDDVSRKVCRNLPHYLHFLNICFNPGDIYTTEDGGFVGCFTLSMDALKLGIEKCVLFSPTDNNFHGNTTLFSAAALGLEED